MRIKHILGTVASGIVLAAATAQVSAKDVIHDAEHYVLTF
jgi:adenine/guanine phosphoribosyltransferase-like PRPP-binding protein